MENIPRNFIPQWAAPKPVFFHLYLFYIDRCRSQFSDRHIIKYADDTVVLSLFKQGDTEHGPILNYFLDWCESSHLQINVSKTKDMMIEFYNSVGTPLK